MKSEKHTRWREIVCVLTGVLLGCASGNQGPPGSPLFEEYFVCFADVRDPELRFDFVITGEEIVAQRSIWPGYKERAWFRCKEIPGDLLARIRRMAAREGIEEGPAGGQNPWYWRALVPRDEEAPAEIVHFPKEDSAMAGFLLALRQATVKPGNRILVPPGWVTSDPRLKYRFWLQRNSGSSGDTRLREFRGHP